MFTGRRQRERGQSVVEFALVLPLMFLLLMAIVDFARIYTTMIAVESGAREAADYGAFGSQRWQAVKVDDTVEEMERRACIATSNLPDYVGDVTTCTNPSFEYELVEEWSIDGLPCDDPLRATPCRVTVTLTYDFSVFVPFRFEIMGVEYGIPSSITFSRDSTFAITDIQIPED
jgi:Flp pilus assembly protein TadG